jgi:hypothetical protein
VRGSLVGERHLIDSNKGLKRLRPAKERKQSLIGVYGSKKQLVKIVNLSKQRNFQRLNADCFAAAQTDS